MVSAKIARTTFSAPYTFINKGSVASKPSFTFGRPSISYFASICPWHLPHLGVLFPYAKLSVTTNDVYDVVHWYHQGERGKYLYDSVAH